MQDVSFHQCVNLGRYNTEKVVSFVPPDGEFELMKYRCDENISLPFRVLRKILRLFWRVHCAMNAQIANVISMYVAVIQKRVQNGR